MCAVPLSYRVPSRTRIAPKLDRSVGSSAHARVLCCLLQWIERTCIETSGVLLKDGVYPGERGLWEVAHSKRALIAWEGLMLGLNLASTVDGCNGRAFRSTDWPEHSASNGTCTSP